MLICQPKWRCPTSQRVRRRCVGVVPSGIIRHIHHGHRMKIIGNSHVPGLITWISNRLSSSASQLYAPRFGISLTDWRVLAFFELPPWKTAGQACASMGFDKAAVSRSIGLLQKRGDVKSRPCGLRKVEYSTTATGKTLYKRMLEVALAREEALLTG